MIPYPIQRFIDRFSELPSVGPRQATRFAFWLLRQDQKELREFAEIVRNLAEKIGICADCFFVFERNAPDQTLCTICRDPKRNRSVIAVVEKEIDLISIEKTKIFHGLYHVLGGTISPLDTKANEKLRIQQLLERIERKQNETEEINEIILALSPTSDGDLTSMELKKKLKPLELKITHLGIGLPRGAEVEFADAETLRNAIEGRR